MFKQLMPLLRQRSVLLTISHVGADEIRVNLVLKKTADSENDALTTPMSFTGTAEELDAQFSDAIVSFVASHLELRNTLARAKEEMDAAAKSAQEDVQANGYILVPAGTPVQGTVQEAKAGGILTGPASLSIEVEQMSLNFPEGAHPVRFATEPVSGTSQVGRAPAGSLVGLLTTKGPEVIARPDQVLRFRMLQPLFVPVKQKDGRQVHPVPVEETPGSSQSK